MRPTLFFFVFLLNINLNAANDDLNLCLNGAKKAGDSSPKVSRTEASESLLDAFTGEGLASLLSSCCNIRLADKTTGNDSERAFDILNVIKEMGLEKPFLEGVKKRRPLRTDVQTSLASYFSNKEKEEDLNLNPGFMDVHDASPEVLALISSHSPSDLKRTLNQCCNVRLQLQDRGNHVSIASQVLDFVKVKGYGHAFIQQLQKDRPLRKDIIAPISQFLSVTPKELKPEKKLPKWGFAFDIPPTLPNAGTDWDKKIDTAIDSMRSGQRIATSELREVLQRQYPPDEKTFVVWMKPVLNKKDAETLYREVVPNTKGAIGMKSFEMTINLEQQGKIRETLLILEELRKRPPTR